MQFVKIMARNNSDLNSIAIPRSTRPLASACVSGLVLNMVAVLAGGLGAWRLGADPGWTKSFFIADGLLSRYQLWFTLAIAAQTSAWMLNRWVASRSTVSPATAP